MLTQTLLDRLSRGHLSLTRCRRGETAALTLNVDLNLPSQFIKMRNRTREQHARAYISSVYAGTVRASSPLSVYAGTARSNVPFEHVRGNSKLVSSVCECASMARSSVTLERTRKRKKPIYEYGVLSELHVYNYIARD